MIVTLVLKHWCQTVSDLNILEMLSMRSPSEVKLSMMRQSASITWHPRRRSLLEPVSARFLSAAVALKIKTMLIRGPQSQLHTVNTQRGPQQLLVSRMHSMHSIVFSLYVFVKGYFSKNGELCKCVMDLSCIHIHAFTFNFARLTWTRIFPSWVEGSLPSLIWKIWLILTLKIISIPL